MPTNSPQKPNFVLNKPPIIREGIEHKHDDCDGRQGWQHVWGGRYCETCWPCTDEKARKA